jgi:hypothetical protein
VLHASPLPSEPGPRQRHRRRRRHRSSQRALVRSKLGPSAASMAPGPTTHHADACSTPHDSVATSPEVSTSATATSHPSVPKETKPSCSSGPAESRCSTAGDADVPVSKKQPEEIPPIQVSRARVQELCQEPLEGPVHAVPCPPEVRPRPVRQCFGPVHAVRCPPPGALPTGFASVFASAAHSSLACRFFLRVQISAPLQQEARPQPLLHVSSLVQSFGRRPGCSLLGLSF